MAGSISSLGVGSGLDLEGLVQNLIAAESRPIQLFQSRQADIDLRISAFGQVQNSLSEFQTALNALSSSDGFRGITATSSDTEILSVTAGQSAVPGSNDITVVQLAQNNRFASQAFIDETEVIGTGTLSFTVGSNAFNIEVDSENNTLGQIRDLINTDNNNDSVRASVISTDDGTRLILTAVESGEANEIAFTVTDDDANDTDDAGLSRLVFGLQEVDIAQDAIIEVDGFTATRSGNEISDVIQGVTLSLESLGDATISVDENLSVATTTIGTLVTAYNSLSSTLAVQRGTSLSGENTLINIEARLREIFSDSFNDSTSDINFLFQVGLSFDRDGVLSFDADTFTEATTNSFLEIQNLFTDSENGLITRLDDVVNGFIETGGILNARTEGLNDERRQLDEDIERIELRLESTEARLRAQFASLDALVAQLNSTSSFLTQQLANLPLANNQN